MDDYLDDGTEDESTDGALGAADAGDDEASLQPVTIGSVKTGEMSPLELADMYRRSRINKSQAAADLKTKIERARNVILKQPTQQSKADWLLGIGSTLLAPGPVGRAGTLGESLGSLGKYVSDVSAQERKAKALQAQQLANFDLTAARAEASAANEDQRALASMMNKYLAQKPAQATTLEREAAAMGMTPKAYLEFKAGLRKKEGDEGLSPSELRGVTLTVKDALSAPKERLDQANTGLEQIRLARKGNPKAEAQVDRALASLVGDKALSLAEVQAVAGAGSFPQRIADSITKFLSGGSSKMSLDEKQELLEAYENYHADKYQREQRRVKNIYSGPLYKDLSPDIFGSPYTSIRQKREAAEAEAASKKPETPAAAPTAPAAPAPAEAAKVPSGAIEMLKSNPAKYRSYFDKKYGAGASKKYLGE